MGESLNCLLKIMDLMWQIENIIENWITFSIKYNPKKKIKKMKKRNKSNQRLLGCLFVARYSCGNDSEIRAKVIRTFMNY